MRKVDRRQFFVKSGLAVGLTASGSTLSSLAEAVSPSGEENQVPSPTREAAEIAKGPAPLYNTNLLTLIGMGDEPTGVLDKFGQLDSRHARVRLAMGAPPHTVPVCTIRSLAESVAIPEEKNQGSQFKWSQSLQDGYLPIVDTEVQSPLGKLRWLGYASDSGDLKAEYVEIKEATAAHRITLWFPFTTEIKVNEGVVTSGDKVLAMFPPPKRFTVSQAKYNLLTPAAWPLTLPVWSNPTPKPLPGVDPAFNSGRRIYAFRTIDYRFPVEPGKAYHVVLGVVITGREGAQLKPGEMMLRLSAGGESSIVDLGSLGPGKPLLHDFVITPSQGEIRVRSETDPSTTTPYRFALINGIWVFDKPVNLEQVKAGKVSDEALFYVRCGEEAIGDLACSVVLDYGPQEKDSPNHAIRLPYDLQASDASKIAAISLDSARSSAREHWDAMIQGGAQFVTGNARLDNLYKASLMNIFLLRMKYPGMANDGQDLYRVKSGATLYEGGFWYRDGAYLVAALDAAGLSAEAEKSLRLFWQPHLPGVFGTYSQQESGVWQSPIAEYDGQGQALWALVNHFELSGDQNWLRTVYGSIRKGALWIKTVTQQTRITTENGEKPIYYGLLPAGEGEAIGPGYNYYHDYWAVLGLRKAMVAAQALHEDDDLKWMTETHDEFCADLLASVKLAYQRVGGNQYIPATPFDGKDTLDIWGGINAVYPVRFLDAHDPMISSTLDLMARHCQEDEYTFFGNQGQIEGPVEEKMWTYITTDWAMCYLLRDDLPMFYRLFNGYVAHASPTNGWVEEIVVKSHLGSGDIPHGWAAAQYVHVHRNCLVYENEGKLELGWGVQPEWLSEGTKIAARKAPTRFGMIDFELQRSGPTLALDYKFAPGRGQASPEELRWHIPPGLKGISSIRINGNTRAIAPGESVIKLSYTERHKL